MLNEFSFGPSQEDEGQKKTVHSMEGSRLNAHDVCPLHPVPEAAMPVESHLLIIRRSQK
jgi:hypothetical protein